MESLPRSATAVVSELITYPVKGCAGVPLNEAIVTGAGLAHDRSFMVIGTDGVFRSQRSDPRLAVIRPAVEDDGGRLTLHAPGADALRVKVDLRSARREVSLFGTCYLGIDQGEDAARWLSDVLGLPSRLVRVPPEHDRVTDGLTPGTSGYADSSAVHILSAATLAELNQRTPGPPLPMSRFRPNIVIDGWNEPHLEDQIRHLTIGNAKLAYTKLAIRCAVTLVEQLTGTKAGPEPLRTLAHYRKASQGGVAFGTKFSVVRPGKITIGDKVTVHAWGDSDL